MEGRRRQKNQYKFRQKKLFGHVITLLSNAVWKKNDFLIIPTLTNQIGR